MARQLNTRTALAEDLSFIQDRIHVTSAPGDLMPTSSLPVCEHTHTLKSNNFKNGKISVVNDSLWPDRITIFSQHLLKKFFLKTL